jgi:hypothetical protein
VLYAEATIIALRVEADMSNANLLRELANKCDELAREASNVDVKLTQIRLAASYRRMAAREEWIDTHPLPERDRKTMPLSPK